MSFHKGKLFLFLILIFSTNFLLSQSFELKNIKHFYLSNKLKVILIQERDTPLCRLRWVVFNGESSSFPGLEGLATLTARTFFKGSFLFPESQLSRLLSYYGVKISSNVREDKTSFSISLPSRNLERFLSILNDLLLRNSFPENSLNEERNLIIKELRKRNEDPYFLTYSFFYQHLFRKTPYTRIFFTEDSLRKITSQNCLTFLKRYYIPNNSLLFVVGDFEVESLKKILEKGFEGWTEKRLFYPYIPSPLPLKENLVLIMDLPLQDPYFFMGNSFPVTNIEERSGLILLNEIIGGSDFSRIRLKYKESLGFCNFIESGIVFQRNSSFFFVSGQCRSDKLREVITGVSMEIKDLKEKRIEEKELQSSKEYIIGDMLVRNSDPEFFLSTLEDAILLGYSLDYMDKVLKEIESFSRDNLLSIVNKYFKIDSNLIVVAGRKDLIFNYLKDLGKIEIYFKINNSWEREK